MKQRVFIFLLILCAFFPGVSKAERKALLIGISDYKHLPSRSDSGISDLRGPLNDLKELNQLLLSRYGFEKRDILILKDKNATRTAIEETVETWLVKGTSENDIILIYFSGHGSRVPDQNGDEKDGWDEVLCPYDMIPKGGKNIILDDELGQWLRRLGKRNTFLIVDSCNSGGVTRGVGNESIALGATPARGTRFIPITDYTPSISIKGITAGLDIPEEIVFLAASRENEVALEIRMADGFHGGFSYSLFKAMTEVTQQNYRKLYSYTARLMKDNLQLPHEPQLVAQENKISSGVLGINRSDAGPAEQSEPVVNRDDPSKKARTVKLSDEQGGDDAPITKRKFDVAGEILNQKVFVAMDAANIGKGSGLSIVRETLGELPFVRIVAPEAYYDRFLNKCRDDQIFCALFTNKVGDATRIDISGSNEMVQARVKRYLKFVYLEKLFAGLRPAVSPFTVQVNIKDENRRDFRIGEKIIFEIEANRDCHIILFSVDFHGRIHILFPNRFQPDNRINRQTRVYIPSDSRSDRIFPIEIQPPAGTEILKAIATTTPLELTGFDFKPGFNPNYILDSTVDKFTEELVETLSGKKLQWAENTLILRTYNFE